MKPIQFAGLIGTLLLGISHSLADETAATITQASDKITHSLSATGAGESAGAGTAIRSGEFVKTGKTALAEMVLDNKAVTRVGPNSVWSYSSTAHETHLQSGTMLFASAHDGKPMTFKVATVTASVTNATVFVQKSGDNVVLGVIQGTAHVTIGSTSADLPAGKIVVTTGTDNRVASFDVPDFVATSAFFGRFQRALPTAKAIDHELADYQDKVSRGFIAPVTPAASSPGDPHEAGAATRHGHEMLNNTMNTAALTGSSRVSSAGFNINGAGLGASSAASLTVNGGSISATSGGSLSMTGAGTVTLAGANSYTGGTTVSAGTIVVSGGSLAGNSGGGVLVGSGVITSTGGTLANVSAGGGSGLTVNHGGGTLTLSGGSTYTGSTTISGGTLGGTGTITITGGTITPGH